MSVSPVGELATTLAYLGEDVGDLVADLARPGPVVCVVSGVSGSGKTTFARHLERAGFTRLSIDALRWAAGGPAARWLPSDDAAAELRLDGKLERLVVEGRDVVVDIAACSRATRDRLRSVVAGAGGRVVLVHLVADRTTLVDRLDGRTWAHADDVPVAVEQLDRYLGGFEVPIGEGAHHFRTDLPPDVWDEG